LTVRSSKLRSSRCTRRCAPTPTVARVGQLGVGPAGTALAFGQQQQIDAIKRDGSHFVQ